MSHPRKPNVWTPPTAKVKTDLGAKFNLDPESEEDDGLRRSKGRLDPESEEDNGIAFQLQSEEQDDDGMSICYEPAATGTQPIPLTEGANSGAVAELVELVKRLSLRMGNMQSQIEAIMGKGTVERVSLTQDQAAKLPIDALSQRAPAYHKQNTGILAIRQQVRSFTRERLGIVDKDMEAWPIADSVLVNAANNNTHGRRMPDPDELALDWGTIGLTTWTIDTVLILSHEFNLNHEKGVFPTIQHLQPPVKTVSKMMKDYLVYLKREYRRKVTDVGGFTRKKATTDKRSRSLGRRQQLLRRRKAMVQHHDFPDIATEILEKLDRSGMSSEESDGELGTGTNTGRIFRIKRLPWRGTELTEWLHRLDRMPTKNSSGAVLARMATYRNRVASDLESQARPPVKGLPRNFYRADWMRLQSKRAAKEIGVSPAEISLPKIDNFTPKQP